VSKAAWWGRGASCRWNVDSLHFGMQSAGYARCNDGVATLGVTSLQACSRRRPAQVKGAACIRALVLDLLVLGLAAAMVVVVRARGCTASA
jgi:hypothetical protein